MARLDADQFIVMDTVSRYVEGSFGTPRLMSERDALASRDTNNDREAVRGRTQNWEAYPVTLVRGNAIPKESTT